MIDTDSPGYLIPPGSVWNDVKDRLIICFEIHGQAPPYQVELILVGRSEATGKRMVEFETVDWPAIRQTIYAGKMQRCPSLESKFLAKTSRPI